MTEKIDYAELVKGFDISSHEIKSLIHRLTPGNSRFGENQRFFTLDSLNHSPAHVDSNLPQIDYIGKIRGTEIYSVNDKAVKVPNGSILDAAREVMTIEEYNNKIKLHLVG